MKYTEEEILSYARSRIKFIDQQKGKRSILGIMGASVIVGFVALTQMLKKMSEKAAADLMLDEKFIAGLAIGILVFVFLGIAAFSVVRMFDNFYGKEIEAFRLLVKLKEGKSER